jgi:tetratricopeptide (TPR) repeat protein
MTRRSKALLRLAAAVCVVVPSLAVHGAAAVTFDADIAPILWTRCAGCHHADGPAPFSLVTFADARQHARQIAEVTARRYMPPWKPEPQADAFVGERRLTDRELRLIAQWVEAGAREGEPLLASAPPQWRGGWVLGEPDLIVQLPAYELRSDGTDVFRNFVASIPGARTRNVRGIEFRPGNRAVHHANLRLDRTTGSRELDAADPAPGYEGVIARSADYPDGHFLGWTPGQAAPLAPAGDAWTLEPGADLVVQLHMQPTGKPEGVQPSVGFYFTSDPPARRPVILRLGRQQIDIPPGAAEYRVSDSYALPVDVEVTAVQPHAHYRARDVRAWAELPDASRRSLIAIRQWDFKWQDQYRYTSPVRLPAGTTIRAEYVFDNSDANARNPDHPPRRVSWGWRTSDEMGDVWIQMRARTDSDRDRLARDLRRKMAAEDAVGCETLITREPAHVNLRNDAAVLYLELGKPQAALAHFEAVQRLQPESASAHYNVGVALEAMGRQNDARRAYEEAVRLNPRYSAAHNNLGNVLLGDGRLDEAREHYERAVDASPRNAEAQNNLGGVLIAFGKVDEAIRHLEEALRLRPEYAEGHFNLARAYAAAGLLVEARDAANTAEREAAAAGNEKLVAAIRALAIRN